MKQCLKKAKQLTEFQWNDIFTQTQLVYEENAKGIIEVDNGTDEDDEWDDVLIQESSEGIPIMGSSLGLPHTDILGITNTFLW